MKTIKPVVILMAEDDPDDQLLTREAMSGAHLNNKIQFVRDGQELLDYLHHRSDFADHERFPRPGIILLDLNMPRMDGREALALIKAEPELRTIPVVVLTTSKAEEDVVRTYELGVSGYITKPVTFYNLIGIMETIGRYWFEVVELPPDHDHA
jgi:CheY-like chemotaxis protein